MHVALGVDDFAFDVKGNLYAMTNFSQTVVRVTPDGTSEDPADLDDGLDGPSSGAFGVGKDRKNLYIANAAFPFFRARIPAGRASCGCISGSLVSRGRKEQSRTGYEGGRAAAGSHLHTDAHTHTYLSTSSAWKRSTGGMVRPSVCAVLRLITNSNCIGRSTGRSAGLLPFRILSIWAAMRGTFSPPFCA